MQPGEMGFLVFAVGAISTFGGVLAWASFMEWRGNNKKRQHRKTHASVAQKINTGDAMQRLF